MAEALHTFVSFNLDIDLELFEWWTLGVDAEEAAKRRVDSSSNLRSEFSATLIEEGIAGEVSDAYRLFTVLEPRLCQPPDFLRSAPLFNALPHATRLTLLERYYQLNALVVRELMSKKLTARDRRDIDDISDRTGVPLLSCKRQFENLRRVWRVLEEGGINTGTLTASSLLASSNNQSGPLPSTVNLLVLNFCIPVQLAWQYACCILLFRCRFDAKRKGLSSMNGASFLLFARSLIEHWSYFATSTAQIASPIIADKLSPSAISSGFVLSADSTAESSQSKKSSASDEIDTDLDKEFLQDLRELRVILDKDTLEAATRLWNSQRMTRSGALLSTTQTNRAEWIRDTVRQLVNIAVKLNRGKEVRDLFVDLMDDVVEPVIEAGWTFRDFENLVLTELRQLDFRFQTMLIPIWTRFLVGVAPILSEMFRSKCQTRSPTSSGSMINSLSTSGASSSFNASTALMLLPSQQQQVACGQCSACMLTPKQQQQPSLCAASKQSCMTPPCSATVTAK